MAATTFVLVHGAWRGGWCWRRVADLLERRGHKVYAPTLTGVADRSHLLAAGIGLDTHISDVANLLKWDELKGVVLCGHSYAGSVISGVAERMPDAIAALVFLDAFVPRNGQALVDLGAAEVGDPIRAAAQRGEISVPPIPAAVFGVNERDRAGLDAQCTPNPINCFLDPVTLTGARARVATKAYVRATGYPGTTFEAPHAVAKADPTWRNYEIPCGHDVMVDMPERVADILTELA